MSRAFALRTLLLVVALRLPSLVSSHFYSGDEATYSALANKILHGGVPYASAVDHKPPGIELTYAALYGVLRQQALWAPRLAQALACWATALLLAAIARRLTAGDAVAARQRAAWAAAAYAVASTFGFASDTQTANTELFLNLPVTAAALYLVSSLESPRLRSSWAAGALVGIATLYKFQAALVGGALVWTAFVALRRRRRAFLGVCIGLASGFVLVTGGVVACFALTGHLDAATYWGWQFNFVYMSVLTPQKILANALEYTALTAILWSPLLVAITVRAPARPDRTLAMAWLVAALLAVSAGGRFFPHYFLMALPAVVLLAAPGLAAMTSRPRSRGLVLALGALCTVFSLVCACIWYQVKPDLRRNTERYVAIGSYVREHSTEQDRLFVWGNSPEVYFYARRVMGTRFPFCNYHTGLIWGSPFYDDAAPGAEAHIVARAWTELVEDLTERPPLYLVDAAAAGLDHFAGHEVARYPNLAAIVQSAYVLEATIEGARIYRRR